MRLKRILKELDAAWWMGHRLGFDKQPQPRITHKKLGPVFYREVQYGWLCGKNNREALEEMLAQWESIQND
jgi:hypothetical protein